MTSKKPKFYVVWRGRRPGVYRTWAECAAQIDGFSGANHKAFETLEVAEEAFRSEPGEFRARRPELFVREEDARPRPPRPASAGAPLPDSYAVDAACSGSPGPVEYRCVHVGSGQELFHQGPFAQGTNNIGEFLAVVHALALLKKRGSTAPIYSDSKIAIGWVRHKTCRTKLACDEANAPLFELIARAEKWLRENEVGNPVLKWETEDWGEIPADFGRK